MRPVGLIITRPALCTYVLLTARRPPLAAAAPAPGDPPSPIFDASTGEKLEVWQTTNADLSPGVKAGIWAAALLQRPIEVGESGARIADELIGKTMLGLWGVNPNSKSTPKKKGILSVEPYKTPAKAGAKAAVPVPDDDGVAF